MFSWITGPRITNAIEDLQPENNYESTIIEAPETPAHEFAVKAFKHAIFGTPAVEDANTALKRQERRAKVHAANAKPIELPAPSEDTPPVTSPSKQPGGVLRTPGTASKGRKTVSFGSQVVDNEGKRGNIGKSGIPNDCPGKFPSPWTPGTQLQLDTGSGQRPRTKLTEALLDARTTKQLKSGQKPKARDDSDITIDLGAPRSESGKYWKEQYESYAERSEKEMKKVIAKQLLAKKFAMKKDGEVTELATKLEQERRKFRQRERDLEEQNKDLQERLRQALADNASTLSELASLEARMVALETSKSESLSAFQQSKVPFDIFEDISKDIDTSLAPSLSMASSGKENRSPSRPSHRRQSFPAASARPSNASRLGAAEGEASIVLGKSPGSPTKPSQPTELTAAIPTHSERAVEPIRQMQKTEMRKENRVPASPAVVLPSSPLPVPSPGMDPWLDLNNESSIPEMDKMAMPVSTGQPYTRAAWNPPPRQHHRSSRSVSHNKPMNITHATSHMQGRSKPEETATSKPTSRTLATREPKVENPKPASLGRPKEAAPSSLQSASQVSPTDPRFDLSKITTHHAEGSTHVKKDRAELPPIDRKEQARKRLEERKKLRKNAPS